MIIDWSDKGLYNDKYLPLLKDNKRYNFLVGSAGSGKSVFISQRELIKTYRKGYRLLAMRKVKETIKHSVFAEFCTRISDYGISDHFKITESPMSIKNKISGSDIIFLGADDPEKLKSVAGVTDVWMEEATEFTKADFDQIDLRLRGTKDLQLTCTLNPIHEDHWINKDFWEKGEDVNTTLLHTTYKDNKWAGEAYAITMERLREEEPERYKIYALGLWGNDLDGLVFKKYETIEAPLNASKFLGYGLDFGYSNDPTALVGLWQLADSIYIQEFIYETGLTNDDIADRMDALGIDKHDDIVADSAEPKSIEELCRRGYNVRPCKKGRDSIMYGINLVQQYKVFIVDSSLNLLKEFRNYQWKKNKNGDVLNKPEDDFNHAIDALRYVMMDRVGQGQDRGLDVLKQKLYTKRSKMSSSRKKIYGL